MLSRFYEVHSLAEENYKGHTHRRWNATTIVLSILVYHRHAAMNVFSRAIVFVFFVCAVQVVALPTPDVDKRSGKSLTNPETQPNDRTEPN